jgi:hypothetical protein
MLFKIANPINGVVYSLEDYIEILRADAAAWSVRELLVVTGQRRVRNSTLQWVPRRPRRSSLG